jgi:hypothetical protein
VQDAIQRKESPIYGKQPTNAVSQTRIIMGDSFGSFSYTIKYIGHMPFERDTEHQCLIHQQK